MGGGVFGVAEAAGDFLFGLGHADAAFGPDTGAPLEPPLRALGEARPLRLRTLPGGTSLRKRWNAYIARHHNFGYRTLVGAQTEAELATGPSLQY